MSRSNYSEDIDNWDLIRWHGQVKSAARGKRGQAMLAELLKALDAMPEKRLIKNNLVSVDGEVCALGCLGRARNFPVDSVSPDDYEAIADMFGVASQLIREIEFQNDEAMFFFESPENRWQRMRDWVKSLLKEGSHRND